MLKKAIILLFTIALLFQLVSAQQIFGCCCEKITNIPNPNTPVLDKTFCPANTDFSELTVTEVLTGANCNTKCGTPITPPPGGTISKCSPTYNPAPVNFRIAPVQSEKKIDLTYDLECPAFISEVVIKRCEGDKINCKIFNELSKISPTTKYTDESSNLRFDQDYTYKLVLKYKSGQEIESSAETGNLGDLECFMQNSNADFCINERYYQQYKNYLQTFGYKTAGKDQFKGSDKQFNDNVIHHFGSKLESSGKCGNKNRLLSPPVVSCKLNSEICQIQNNKPVCTTKSNCDINAGPLGLFPKTEDCEGTIQTPKNCYLDKSSTIIDKCYSCNQVLDCFNYKSKEACRKNQCSLQNCEWKDTIPELGVGVCVNTKINNCQNCEKNSGVLDVCTKEKAEKLSTQNYACYFSVNKAFSCDAAACTDYKSQAQCGAPTGGIKLDENNNIISKSTDTCGIEVCDFIGNICLKNADGDSSTPDCKLNNKNCELDHFPPETEIYSSKIQGASAQLNIRIKDKENAAETLTTRNNKDFEIFVCILSSSQKCGDPKTFTKLSNNKNLITINQLELLDVKDKKTQNKISDLQEGSNTIKFYGKDSANNLGIIKEYQFTACSNCTGAGVASYYIKDALDHNKIFYTKTPVPTIIIELLNPAKVVTSKLEDAQKKAISSTPPPQTEQDTFEFQPGQYLTEGSYTFTFDAETKNGLFLEKPVIVDFVVDTTKPSLKILPEENTVVNTSKTDLLLNFSENAKLTKAELTEQNYLSAFVKKTIKTELKDKFKPKNDQLFTYALTNDFDGKKTLSVEAEDYAGNKVSSELNFFTASKGGKIIVISPSWGVSPSTPINLEIVTNKKAKCGYLFDSPTMPVINQQTFDASMQFTTTGDHTHQTTSNLIKTGDLTEHKIDFICKSDKEFFHERILVSIDPTGPEIKSAFARPKIIQETTTTISSIYQTIFVVELNEEGFCKYSPISSDYNTMGGLFKDFNEQPKKILETPVNITLLGDHSFNIVCANKAGILSPKNVVEFKVDPSAKYYIESLTQKAFTDYKIKLRVYSSKKALCFYGKTQNEVKNPFSQGGITQYHFADVSESATTLGKLIYYVKCQTPAGETAETTIETFIDPTPPTINVDASTDYQVKTISWMNDKVKIKLSGEDPETNISHFEYNVKNNKTGEIFVDWNKTQTNASFYARTLKKLEDGTQYVVLARSFNKAGMNSSIKQSDVILVNSTFKPSQCFNKVKDGNELDVDCGGNCGKKCSTGQECRTKEDCESLVCESDKCQAPSCTDKIISPTFETDLGCGSQCPACALGLLCNLDSDCAQGKCISGICSEDLCSNGALDETTGETGIDCGGVCKICIEDSDKDGVLDKNDKCPNTPKDLLVEKTGSYAGCTEEQKYELWSKQIPKEDRDKNKDPDKDGLVNSEEFKLNTDPLNEDTDGDNWSDGVEIENKTDPLDETDHPSSTIWFLIKWLIILAVLGGLGYGGYFYYKKYGLQIPPQLTERFPWLSKMPGAEQPTIPRMKRPVYIPPKTLVSPPSFEKLKKIAKEKQEFIPLGELRAKHYKKDEVFEKLKKFSKKSSSKKRVDEKVFEKLKDIKKKDE